ncbi:MAG: cell envelope integrity protein CreD [Bacteroidetes bacterium]|nr:cell envelope integrity protein CreD [Bacteroidota bacterium]
MTNIPSFSNEQIPGSSKSITIRLFTIGILILLLLIPVSMVESLIREREGRQSEAMVEVSSKWGGQQTITGLVLTVPYKTNAKVYEGEKTDKFKLVESREYAHFLPEELNISGEISPEVRYRGIYEVIVYNSKIKLNGKFSPPGFEEWKIDNNDVIWEDAYISLGLSDLRSIQENISVNWNDKQYFFNPGIESNDVISTGISSRLPLLHSDSSVTELKFSLDLNFNGSTSLNFIPLGKMTKVDIKSKWENPSFIGAFLPDNRVIDHSGFSANWKIFHLNRPYPQSFRGGVQGIHESSFGVNLIVPVDEYQKSMRSAKYAVIFITLTFLIFFFVQILNGVRIHPIQYIIVGLALCVFYTLLIALSEHIAFKFSYLISSLAIISMITLYAKTIFNDKKLTTLIGGILSILYLFIFSIIQMEDYALLMGSIGLFIVLATIMYLSRKINWYAIKTRGGDNSSSTTI